MLNRNKNFQCYFPYYTIRFGAFLVYIMFQYILQRHRIMHKITFYSQLVYKTGSIPHGIKTADISVRLKKHRHILYTNPLRYVNKNMQMAVYFTRNNSILCIKHSILVTFLHKHKNLSTFLRQQQAMPAAGGAALYRVSFERFTSPAKFTA